jgi:hypothetical protein
MTLPKLRHCMRKATANDADGVGADIGQGAR